MMKKLLRMLKGVSGKILSLVILPILIMAAINVFSANIALSLFGESQSLQNKAIEASDKIMEFNDTLKGEMIITSNVINIFLQMHQTSLLSKNPDMLKNNIAARNKSARMINNFAQKINRFERLLMTTIFVKNKEDMTALAGNVENAIMAKTAQEYLSALRNLQILNRVANSQVQVFDLFSQSNKSTMKLIEEKEFENANSNFIYEEAARLEAVNIASTKIIKNLNQLVIYLSQDIKISRTELNTNQNAKLENSFNMIFIALAVLSITLIILAGIYAALSLTNPLQFLAKTLGQLAAGNKDNEMLAPRSDELGDMSVAMQLLRESLLEMDDMQAQKIINDEKNKKEKQTMMTSLADNFQSKIGGSIAGVSSAATEMFASSEEMSSIAEDTSKRSSVVANAALEASANVQTVASATEELSVSVREIGAKVQQSSLVSKGAVITANKTTKTIQSLSKSVEKISEVVGLINDIAEQTNLLALNATIEAARAGDSGKGFAVVASEVKNLASQTAKATEEIGSQIEAVQINTDSAVTDIDNVSKTIEEINIISAAISAAVEQQSAATLEIAKNIEEASVGTSSVTENIQTVEKSATETGEAANGIKNAASELSEQGLLLQSEVDKFLHEVRTS